MDSTEVNQPARPYATEKPSATEKTDAVHEPSGGNASQQDHQEHQDQQIPQDQQTGPTPRAPLSADPDLPAQFRDAVRPLDDIDARPVAGHAETYDAVHRDLRAALDDVDRSSN